MEISETKFYTPTSPEMRIIGAPQTLARWRSEGSSCLTYTKSGSRILYSGKDILAFLDGNRVDNSAQSKGG